MSAGPRIERRSEGLVLAPFRGLRFAPARVGGLDTVTAPPYDVVDADKAAALERADAHNVVRLILPRDDASGGGRYRHAAQTLDAWLAEGALEIDDDPALYLYEQQVGGRIQRGLVGAVGLHPPEDGVVLPHEDVMPGPVADRLALLRATAANFEPILLVSHGGDRTATLIEEVAATEPVMETTTADEWHRLWAITDRGALAAIASDLASASALIADGHHRYAAYRAYQQERHRAGDGAGPWDFGLALLVDTDRYPLEIKAIHRVVAGLPYDEALGRARGIFEVRELAGAAAPASPGTLVITDGVAASSLTVGDADFVDDVVPRQRDAAWRRLDATVLHEVLLTRLWNVAEPDVTYEHDTARAVAAARASGLAVLLAPVDVGTVTGLARRAERMPRKSTSFGPKPRSGLVMRRLKD